MGATMKVIAVRNPLLHPFSFHQVSITRELDSRSLIVRYRLARTGHYEVDPVFDAEEQEVRVNLAVLRNRPDWCDHQCYFLSLKDGRLGPLFSLFVATLPARLAATEFATMSQQSLILGINVPFADATDDELFLTVNMNQRCRDADISLDGDLYLEWSQAASSGTHRTLLLPHLRLSAPSTIAADGQATITIQLEDAAEQPIERQATVYLEAVSGVLPRARVTTTQGTAAVPVFATGLRPGEKVRIKAGWKYFPGVDDITLEVAQGHQSGVRWADALSASVRPVITYWFMGLYCAAKTAAFAAALTAGAGWGEATLHAWTEADQALWAGVLNFWFLGRVFDRVRS